MESRRILFLSLLCFTVLLLRLVFSQHAITPNSLSFAHEYGHLASSVTRGKGMVNPFGDNAPNWREVELDKYFLKSATGARSDSSTNSKSPTTQHSTIEHTHPNSRFNESRWMPPFYVYFQASIFRLCGINSMQSAQVIFYCKVVFLCLALAVALGALQAHGFSVLVQYFFGLLFILCLTFGTQAILENDVPFHMFLATFAFFLPVLYAERPSKINYLSLCALACILSYSVPTILLAFLTLLAAMFFTAYSAGIRWSLIGVIFLSIGILYTSHRSVQSEENSVFIKSNVWHEFYQANVLDDDGIYEFSTFMRNIPLFNPDKFYSYQREGENAYLGQYFERSLQWLQQNPIEYSKKVLKRLGTLLFFMPDPHDLFRADVRSFYYEDLRVLLDRQFITYAYNSSTDGDSGYFWLMMRASDGEFKSLLEDLPLVDAKGVYYRWLSDRNEWNQFVLQRNVLGTGVLFSALPTLALLLLLRYQNAWRPMVFLSLTFVGVYFLPYVLIAYYYRYHVPVFATMMLWPVLFVQSRWSGPSQSGLFAERWV